MSTINVFYQGEGIADIAHIEADEDDSFASIKAKIVEKHGLEPETLIFIEDDDNPVDEKHKLCHHAGKVGVKAHIHRCRQVEVSVAFNGETVSHRFGPSTTVARVKKWAAQRKFGMSPQEAGEHVLQISGAQDRPDPGAHLGRLATCPDCRIEFDLVPNERVNGAFRADGVRA